MTPQDNPLVILLNKEEFVKELLEEGIAAEAIESEWQKIENIFVLLFLQFAYTSLSESDQNGLGLTLTENSGKAEIEKFMQSMNTFLQKNPGKIDTQTIAKQAAEETLKQYVIHVKGNN